MKKLLVFLLVLVAVSIFPLAAYANGYDHHDRAHHEQMWRDHEREWREHDREWRAHRGDRHWREVHSREWHDWYRWHEDNEHEFHFHVSDEGFDLDIAG